MIDKLCIVVLYSCEILHAEEDIRFDVPRTLDGRRRQVAQACPGLSKKQAEQQLREIECQVARGTLQVPRQLQVGAFMDVWLSHIRGGVEDSTFASYETIIRGHISAKHIVVKGTKTRRVRVVTLNDSLVTVLNHHRETTVHRQPDDWICGEEDGQHVNPHHLTIYFARLMRELGLKLTLHGLRHTHASALLAAGIPVKVISERLGHASVTLTQDIYAHVLPTMQREAAEKMEAIWGGALNAVPTNERNKRKGNSRLVCTFRSKS